MDSNCNYKFLDISRMPSHADIHIKEIFWSIFIGYVVMM